MSFDAVLGQFAPPTPRRRPLAWLAMAALRGYRRWLSPLLPPACRFYPSCSQYALLAVATHRLPRALWLIATRLLRCQPLCRGGEDWPPAGPLGATAAQGAAMPLPHENCADAAEGCSRHPHATVAAAGGFRVRQGA